MLRVMARLVADAVLIAILLFSAAGTLTWWRAWLLLAVLVLVRALGVVALYRGNPALLLERARLPIHGDQPCTDKLLLLAVLTTGFMGLPVIAGLDAFRWHILPRPAPLLADLGLVLFTLGWALKNLALRANAFAIAVVRLQHERAHAVVDSGVYSIVRQPLLCCGSVDLRGARSMAGVVCRRTRRGDTSRVCGDTALPRGTISTTRIAGVS
jgi:protein-S-isoprenylcysteine O-methyltransferase Ste14